MFFRHCGFVPQSPKNKKIAGQARNDGGDYALMKLRGKDISVQHLPF